MSSTRSSARGPLLAVLALALPIALVAGLVVWWNGGIGTLVGRERCTVESPDGAVELDAEQVQHAATIAAVAHADGLPERAVTVGLATAMQESKLYNLPEGDHDSAGLFQQRPSQGWGSFDQVTDPVYASKAFFTALLHVDQWEQLPVTKAAQAVQRSAYPDAYADHAQDAKVLAAALTGRRAASLSCTVRSQELPPQKLDDSGLTARATTLRTTMEDEWGTQSLGGFAPGGVKRPNPSAHNEGRAVDIFFEPYQDAESRREGWAMAHWLVAHAEALDVSVIIYRDRIWSAEHSPEGWREYTSPFGDPKNPTQRHLDHVHAEVS